MACLWSALEVRTGGENAFSAQSICLAPTLLQDIYLSDIFHLKTSDGSSSHR